MTHNSERYLWQVILVYKQAQTSATYQMAFLAYEIRIIVLEIQS